MKMVGFGCQVCNRRDWDGELLTLHIEDDDEDEEYIFCSLACVAEFARENQDEDEDEEYILCPFTQENQD